MTPPLPAGVRVGRDGRVWQARQGQEVEVGWVDRADYRTGRRAYRWRWVLPGGSTILPTYATRHDAVLALCRQAGIIPKEPAP